MLINTIIAGVLILTVWEPAALPAVEPVFRERVENTLSTAFQLQAGGASRSEVEGHVRLSAQELLQSYGMPTFIEQSIALTIEKGKEGEEFPHIMFPFSLILIPELKIQPTDIVKTLAPYLPAEDPSIRSFLEREILKAFDTNQSAPENFRVDFSVFVEILKETWESGDQKYHGLIDYMFERHAIMAWLAMLEIEGEDEQSIAEHYNVLLSFARPYNWVPSRTDPNSVDPQVIEDCRALLREFVQDHSLWARVFVAEILNKVPYMRDPAIEETLRADPHWLIQRRMGYLDEEAPDAAGE